MRTERLFGEAQLCNFMTCGNPELLEHWPCTEPTSSH